MWLARQGLRVLVYHRVCDASPGPLTVTTTQLRDRTAWLRARQFIFVSVADVIDAVAMKRPLPDRSVLLTFDDAYVDTFELARPVLDEFGVRAAVFVPTAFVGQRSTWDEPSHPLMDRGQLHSLAADGWEVGLHSHRHLNYALTDAAEIARDIRANLAALVDFGLSPVPALAYPYGRRPRTAAARQSMRAALADAGVRVGFRIGNRVNQRPMADPFEINRLDIRGDRSLASFRRKVRWGRLL